MKFEYAISDIDLVYIAVTQASSNIDLAYTAVGYARPISHVGMYNCCHGTIESFTYSVLSLIFQSVPYIVKEVHVIVKLVSVLPAKLAIMGLSVNLVCSQ